MILINCDIGERGAGHPIDVKLMDHIGMANIACGGHAGDSESISFFQNLAFEKKIKISAHLSYPDRENFGRYSMDISFSDLGKSLTEQFFRIQGVDILKFHGALYNDANVNMDLAQFLAQWLSDSDISNIVTPFDSALSLCCQEKGITVIAEAFAERRYVFDSPGARLLLVPRSQAHASISNCEEAIEQSRKIIKDQLVFTYSKDGRGNLIAEEKSIEAETICIHSDSEIALELAQGLSRLGGNSLV